MKLTLVTPEKKILTGQEVESILVPAYRGELNILEGHTPLVTTLETGIMRWKIKGEDRFHYAVVSWGYAEVFPNGVDILADIADLPEDINVEEAQKYLNDAKTKVTAAALTEDDYENLYRGIRRVEAGIDLASNYNTSPKH